jgi:hypothetical protein
MEQENKDKLIPSLETIKILSTNWTRVKDIAEDIIAYVNKDLRRFKIEVDIAVGTKIIRAWIAGTHRYAGYGESVNEITLKQLYERFFSDNEALVYMIRRLAEAIAEIADEKIKKLEEQLEE